LLLLLLALRMRALRALKAGPTDADQGILQWVLPVRHSLFNRLRTRLVASDTKDRSAGKCSIEVWAEDEYSDEVTELAYCRGMLCPRESRVIVLWLGRSDARTVHQRARGRRSIEAGGTEYTLAEGLFGLVAAIASLFKVSIVELQAKDNGSGKLVDLYLKLGFTKRPQTPGEILWMEAPLEPVACIAPTKWLSGLMPESFDACGWMHETLTRMRRKATLKALCQEPLRWNASLPEGARVIAKLTPSYAGDGRCEITRILIEVSLIDPYDEPLAWASANVRLDNQFCRVTWLGRQKSQPVHQRVRGIRLYKVPPRPGEASGKDCEDVTPAIALLGVLAALSCRLDAKVLHLQCIDGGSGKLVDYFRRFGFAEPVGGCVGHPKPDTQPFLSAQCYELMQRCLPVEWAAQLLVGSLADNAPAKAPPAEAQSRLRIHPKNISTEAPPSVVVESVAEKQPADAAPLSVASGPSTVSQEADRVSARGGKLPRVRAASKMSHEERPQMSQTAGAFRNAGAQVSAAACLASDLLSSRSSPSIRPSSASDKRSPSHAKDFSQPCMLPELSKDETVLPERSMASGRVVKDAQAWKRTGSKESLKAQKPKEIGPLMELTRKRRLRWTADGLDYEYK